MRLTIFHEILLSVQFVNAEFSDEIVFCDSWHLPMFAPVNFQTIALDEEDKWFSFDEILYSAQVEGGKFNSDNHFL